MKALFEITEGWTAPLDLQLLINGKAFDATGMAVSGVLHDKSLANVAVNVAWLDIQESTVRVSPMDQTFVAAGGPYWFRIQVIDNAGKIAYFPPGDPSVIRVAPK